MVGLVLCSHSHALAQAAAELACGVGTGDLPIVGIGGVGDQHAALGIDTTEIMDAIQKLDGVEGVLVLADLGGAVMAAETAIDLLDGMLKGPARLDPAPLVEGAVAAAIQIRLGADLERVASEALEALTPKRHQLLNAAEPSPAPPAEPGADAHPATPRDDVDVRACERVERFSIESAHGLHVRPAAELVRTLGGFNVRARARRADGGDWVDALSMNRLALLGIRQGDLLEVAVSGADTDACLAAVRRLVAELGGESTTLTPGAEQDPNDPAPTQSERPAREGQSERADAQQAANAGSGQWVLRGIAVSPGVAAAPLFVVGESQTQPPDASSTPRTEPLEQQQLNPLLQPLRLARDRLTARIQVEAAQAERDGHPEIAEIARAHAVLLVDPDLDTRAARQLGNFHCSPTEAFQFAAAQIADRYRSLDDPYMQARAADVQAVAQRLVAELEPESVPQVRLPATPSIIVVQELSPDLALRLDPALARGVASVRGSATAHGAIIARGLGLPMLVGLPLSAQQLGELAGRPAVLDAGRGTLEIDPPEDRLTRARALVDRAERDTAVQRAAAKGTARLADGTPLPVLANIATAADCRVALAAGAEGIGLLRTELAFADAAVLADEEAQVRVLKEMLALMRGAPATLRLLDLGADKPPPGHPRPLEANPFLGVRGVRLLLARECGSLLETHLRALLRAAQGHAVKLMIPMVVELAEIDAVATALARAHQTLNASGTAHAWPLSLGIMVETPAAALRARELAAHCAFFSIGSNDLTQYVMAAERGNAALSAIGDALHPAVLRAIETTCDGARSHAIPVSLCGEIGSDPDALPVLVGLGISGLSISPAALARVKTAIRGLDPEQCRDLAQQVLTLDSAAEVRAAAHRARGDPQDASALRLGGIAARRDTTGQV